jgi:hypothetical protein
MSNTFVIGMVVYEGLPDGAVFRPEIEAKFNVDYADIPYGLTLRTQVRLYDEDADIWRTYKTLNVVATASRRGLILWSPCGPFHNDCCAGLRRGGHEYVFLALTPMFHNR